MGATAPNVLPGAIGTDALDQPKKTILIFGSEGCAVCAEKAPLIRKLGVVQQSWKVVYVFAGQPEDLPGILRDGGSDLDLLFDASRAVHSAFDVQVSPFALVVDDSGRVAAKGLVTRLGQLVQLLINAGDRSLIPLRDDLLNGRVQIEMGSNGSLMSRSISGERLDENVV